MLYTVRGLHDRARGIDIRVRVITLSDIRTVHTQDKKDHRVVDVKVGDRTGTIMLTLWDEHVDEIMQGDLIDIRNGYINKFKGRLRLNIGRYGVLEKVEDAAFPTREQLMSRYR